MHGFEGDVDSEDEDCIDLDATDSDDDRDSDDPDSSDSGSDGDPGDNAGEGRNSGNRDGAPPKVQGSTGSDDKPHERGFTAAFVDLLTREAPSKARTRHVIDAQASTSFQCKNERFGCSYRTSVKWCMDSHFTTCQYTSVEAAERMRTLNERERPMKCPLCTASYEFLGGLDHHLWTDHHWKPHTCHLGCDDGEVYETISRWSNHRAKFHGSYQPTRCKVIGCKSEWLYATASS